MGYSLNSPSKQQLDYVDEEMFDRSDHQSVGFLITTYFKKSMYLQKLPRYHFMF